MPMQRPLPYRQKKKEDDDAIACAEKERLRKERENEEREGIIKGTYPKQDLFKSIDYLRAHGMGKGYIYTKRSSKSTVAYYYYTK